MGTNGHIGNIAWQVEVARSQNRATQRINIKTGDSWEYYQLEFPELQKNYKIPSQHSENEASSLCNNKSVLPILGIPPLIWLIGVS